MKQTVEEAAREFSDYNGCMPNASHSIIKQSHQRAFIRGAEWQARQSPWHLTSKELPDIGRHVVNEDWFDFKAKDEKDLKRIIKQYPFKIWAYVDDLMPHDFDQILEANKDILQRMKEKGD